MVGAVGACSALGLSRASFYRHRSAHGSESKPAAPVQEPAHELELTVDCADTAATEPGPAALTPAGHAAAEPDASSQPATDRRRACPVPGRALTLAERQTALDILHSPRFMDQTPHEVYGTLIDEDMYVCSISTYYRILRDNKEVSERRNQLRHPTYTKPELLATAPNQLWSWDITKLLGPEKWTYYYLYVILDVFSRYVVGWHVAAAEAASIAEHLIHETCLKQSIQPEQLTIHADRGTSMTSHPVAMLLADLGVTKSHSRPHVSNDNPYSEAQFKTFKYRPEFPERFGSIQDARSFCRPFFEWYNNDHHHTGISLLTPAALHYGQADAIVQARNQVLARAYEQHPQRFVRKPPVAQPPPSAVWINRPEPKPDNQPE